MSAIRRLLEGAIDIHCHFSPDARVERRADALETARASASLGLRGLVLKSHDYPSAPLASALQPSVQDLYLFGGVCLNEEVGGLNPLAVETAARTGGKVVWFPTFSSAADRQRQGLSGGISILTERGDLRPEVEPVLEVIKRYDMVLATGHLSPRECFALVEAARGKGIGRIVITHASTLAVWLGLTVEDQKNLARRGALLEHCVWTLMPLTLRKDPRELVEEVREVGAENCILSTDFGQAFHPIPPEGLRMGIALLLQAGLSEEEVGLMVQYNPARLLGLG